MTREVRPTIQKIALKKTMLSSAVTIQIYSRTSCCTPSQACPCGHLHPKYCTRAAHCREDLEIAWLTIVPELDCVLK